MHTHLGGLGVTGFLMRNLSAKPLDYVEGGAFEARRLELSRVLDSTNPDLSAFHARGGRMIVTTGTNDTLASPGAQLDYYQAVLDTMGRTTVDEVARLFVMPQGGHGLSGTSYFGVSALRRGAAGSARVLGAAILEHGVTARALRAYDAALCPEISAVVLRNRGAGPFGLLNLLDERCGGVFDDIDAVIPPAERDEFMSRCRTAAGLAMETLNAAPPIVRPGARAVWP